MTSKKDLIIAVLATFCLTATLFMIVPTRSQSGSYDARTDVNGDGTIDMADISIGIDGFMTSGDPTLNVTITGHANKLAYTVNQTALVGWAFESPPISIVGYSKVTVCAIQYPYVPNSIEVQCRHDGPPWLWFTCDAQLDFGSSFVRTYDAPNEQVRIVYVNNGAIDTVVYIDVYLIA